MATGKIEAPMLLTEDHNGVRIVRFNRPAKLNGWSPQMMEAMGEALAAAAADNSVNAVVLTGSGKYYCAGVDFAGSLKPMHPRKLKEAVSASNEALFEQFIGFPKPLFVAANGPAIGAPVTSAKLCDQIIASEEATFLTPFKGLGLVPEGCSSLTFPKLLGPAMAKQVLEGKKLDAKEALALGFVDYVVPGDQLLNKAQEVAEAWVAAGRPRRIVADGLVEELRKVNARESVELANAMLDYPFLNHMVNFLWQKGKYGPFFLFFVVRALRPIWSRL